VFSGIPAVIVCVSTAVRYQGYGTTHQCVISLLLRLRS